MRRLGSNLLTQLQRISAGARQGELPESSALATLLLRAAAVVITCGEAAAETSDALLHAIAFAPVHVFTRESLQLAVSVWTWILAARYPAPTHAAHTPPYSLLLGRIST